MIYETRGEFAGKPRSVLPVKYQMIRPITSRELAERLRQLAWVYEQNGAYKKVNNTPIGSVFKHGRAGIVGLLRVDLWLFIAANRDLFPQNLASSSMTYIDMADVLRGAAVKLEAMK